MIRFTCPECGKGFQVKDGLAGRKTKCPNCKGPISIPGPSHSASEAAAEAATEIPVAKPPPRTVASKDKAFELNVPLPVVAVAGVLAVVISVFVWSIATRDVRVSAYRNVPQSAHEALTVVKKVEARTEVGINYRDYSTLVGEAWADVKVFADSSDGKAVPEFTALLLSTMSKQKLALDTWQQKIEDSYSFDVAYDMVLQGCWRAAGRRLKVAESLLSGDDVPLAISRAATLQKSDDTYEETIRSLLPQIRKIYYPERPTPEDLGELKQEAEKIAEVLITLMQQDLPIDD